MAWEKGYRDIILDISSMANKGYQDILLEMNSMVLMNLLKRKESGIFSLMLHQLRDPLQRNYNLEIYHVFLEGNHFADLLANLTLNF